MAAPELCPHCGSGLDSSLGGLCSRCVAADVFSPSEGGAPSALLPAGETGEFGDFILLKLIARGGMGVVYQARQRSLDRLVAVKMIASGLLAGEESIARFRGEAHAAAGLRHPHIVGIHETGEQQGQHYLAMEFVGGPTLAQLLREGPLPARRAALHLSKVAGAVHYAHSRGVLHRDLKPSNILIDEQDEPRVTDFGLAKRLDRGADLTLTGQMLGTPAYMAPEQIAGQGVAESGPSPAPRSSTSEAPTVDVYGLGATLYHALTGRAPFAGESVTQILRQVVESEPVSLRLLNPTVPTDLETITLKCLEKSPERRYTSAAALAEDLQRFLQDEPIHARPITPAERAARWCRRKPALSAALGIILLLVVGLLLTTTRSARRMDRLRLATLTNLYAADLRLAGLAVQEGKLNVALDLLERHRPRPDEPDLRGFEWFHFMERCRSDEAATLGTNHPPGQAAAFSPDGRFLASAGQGVSVWEAATRRLVRHVPTADFVSALAFAPDGETIAIAIREGTILLQSVSSTNPPRVLQGRAAAGGMHWSADGTSLTVAARNKVQRWRPSDGTLLGEQSAGDLYNRVDFAAGTGHFLATVPGWKLVLRDPLAPTNRLEISLPAPARSAALAPDGLRGASGNYSGTITLYDLATGSQTNLPGAHRGMIETLAYSRDGRMLASAGSDRVIRLWDAATGRALRELRGHHALVMRVAFSADGAWLISNDMVGAAKLWNLQEAPDRLANQGLTPHMISADGTLLLLQESNRPRQIYSLQSRGLVRPSMPRAFDEMSVRAFTTNLLIGRTYSGLGRVLGEDGQVMEEARPELEITSIPMVTPDGRFVGLISTNAHRPLIWDRALGSTAFLLTNAPDRNVPWVFAPNSRMAALGLAGGEMVLVDLPPTRPDRRFMAHRGWAYACGFSPDARHLATAGFDGTARLWDTARTNLLGEFRSSADSYWCVALSPDGRRLAAGTGEGTIVIWDTSSRLEVAALVVNEAPRPVEGRILFTPDGSNLIYSSGQVWRLWRTAGQP